MQYNHPFPNCIFITCLKSWLKEARENNTKFQYTLNRALLSLKKYPLPLKDGIEAYIIQGIGEGLAQKLQDYLDSYVIDENIKIPKLYPSLEGKNYFEHNFVTHNESNSNLDLSTSILENQCNKTKNFDLILYIDASENNSKLKRYVKSILIKNKAKVEVKKLPVGDFLWVICFKGQSLLYLMPHIIERKKLDDLSHSIKDGRYREQKFRLRKMENEFGLKPIYLIEGMNSARYGGLPISTLQQAAINTLIVDDFHIMYSDNLKHSVNLLLLFHINMMKKLSISTEPDLKIHHLPYTFDDLTKIGGKNKNLTVKDIFAKHLLVFHGMSMEKVSKILEVYPTFQHLYQAYQNCPNSEEEDLLIAKVFSKNDKKLIAKNLSQHLAIYYNDR